MSARRRLIPATPLRAAGGAAAAADPEVTLASLQAAFKSQDKLEGVGPRHQSELRHWCRKVELVVKTHPIEGYRDIFTTVDPIIPKYNSVTFTFIVLIFEYVVWVIS